MRFILSQNDYATYGIKYGAYSQSSVLVWPLVSPGTSAVPVGLPIASTRLRSLHLDRADLTTAKLCPVGMCLHASTGRALRRVLRVRLVFA